MIDLLKRGGLWYEIPGLDPSTFITNLVNRIKLPENLDRELFCKACLERELVSATAMGKGIAFPHPRTAFENIEPFIALAYPRFPIDWNASDEKSVFAAFLIVAKNREEHLAILSKLAKLCYNEQFLALLKDEANLEKLLAFMKEQSS